MTASPFAVHCPSCSSEFPVDPGKVPATGVHAICSVCLRVFHVTVPAVTGALADGPSDWTPDGLAVAVAGPGVSLDEDLDGHPGTAAPGGPDVDDSVLEDVPDFEAVPDFEDVADFAVDSDAEPAVIAGDLEVSEHPEVTDGLDRSDDFGMADSLELPGPLEAADPLEVADVFHVPDPDADYRNGLDRAVPTEEDSAAEWDPELPADPEGGEGLDISADFSVGAEFDIGDDLDGGTHLLVDEDTGGRSDLRALDELITLDAGEDASTGVEVEFGPLDEVSPVDQKEPAPLEGKSDSPVGTHPGSPPGFQDLTSLAQEAIAEGPGAGSATPVDSSERGATVASGAPRFGRRDPSERARHLARVLVSDIIAYHPERYRESFAQGTLQEDFRVEVDKSWKEYVDQVGIELAESTPYFREALNDVLGQGRHLF